MKKIFETKNNLKSSKEKRLEICRHKGLRSSQPYTRPPRIVSIQTNWESFSLAYSPDFVNCSPRVLIDNQLIEMSGSRRNDYLAAEGVFGNTHIPNFTVWHHVFIDDDNWKNNWHGRCYIQLVHYRQHENTKPHVGSCGQYVYISGHSYNNARDASGTITFPDDIFVPQYTEEQLAEFEKNVLSAYNLKIPPFLHKAYIAGTNFLADRRFVSKETSQEIDSYLWLTKKEGEEHSYEIDGESYPSASIEEILETSYDTMEVSPTETAMIFGMGACGDYFFADEINGGDVVWFHDHEGYDLTNFGWYKFEDYAN